MCFVINSGPPEQLDASSESSPLLDKRPQKILRLVRFRLIPSERFLWGWRFEFMDVGFSNT